MNYHDHEWVMDCVCEHLDDAYKHFPEDRIVGIHLAGSQNYGLDMENSDVDTKLVVVPSFNDIVMNKQPVSTTHIRENGEHIGFHDVRLYIPTFRKGNVNFVETLFSEYSMINPLYANEWNRLVEAREEIARYDVVRAIHAMRGTMYNKYKLLASTSGNHADAFEKFGYSPKEYYCLLRTEEFITRYINGEPYADCLMSKQADFLKSVKSGCYTAGDALWMAKVALDRTNELCDKFLGTCDKTVNEEIGALLDDVQYNIMKIAMKKELGE